ncbi:MAG TPA: hypothetical protein PKY95_12640, partial [candidate division Zixibacteria bacterium]|nr:hypothetical protein [candidate division Zixibacteria bacterium]
MKRAFLTMVALGLVLGATAGAQEVVIPGFPEAVGGSIGEEFFQPYYADLQALADTLAQYPLMLAVVTGGADGLEYREHHDAKNPG